jgi:hypothetical protein
MLSTRQGRSLSIIHNMSSDYKLQTDARTNIQRVDSMAMRMASNRKAACSNIDGVADYRDCSL